MLRLLLLFCVFALPVFGQEVVPYTIDISGRVTSEMGGLPLTQVTVSATDASSSNGTVYVGVSPFGYYTFYDLEGGNNYLIEAHGQKKFVAFTPDSMMLAGTHDWTGVDFSYSIVCFTPCVR